jgi:carbamoyltransferase
MGDYLVDPRESPFMTTSFTCQSSRRERVPAVVHVDQTLRPQTVKDGRFGRLIEQFGQLTGEFLLLNTSMNLMGEPIVNHPREALRCFIDSGMDCLVMGNYVVEKCP